MEKNFCFFLESHIYVSFKEDKMLLYDTHSGKSLFVVESEPIQLVRRIYEDENLGSVELSERDFSVAVIRDFVNDVVASGMGQLVSAEQQSTKPVVLLPILSLNFDVDRFKDKEFADAILSRNVSKYLLDINILLNGLCQQECVHCGEYCKQFFCCSKNGSSSSLPKEFLMEILRQTSYYPVHTINLTGGNIYQYGDLDVLGTSDNNGNKIFNFYVHYLNYQENSFVDSQNIHLMINFPVNMEKLNEVHLLTRGKKTKYHLIIENEEQYNELELALSKIGIADFEVHPFYNGNNQCFFEESVFLSEEDILASPISMREIFRNQKLNANSFGSLYILPNGDVKANLNEERIGNVGSDRIIDVINDEMKKNTAWRRIRLSEPCCSCVYQYLCPPISNYERALKKQNLCHVCK